MTMTSHETSDGVSSMPVQAISAGHGEILRSTHVARADADATYRPMGVHARIVYSGRKHVLRSPCRLRHTRTMPCVGVLGTARVMKTLVLESLAFLYQPLLALCSCTLNMFTINFILFSTSRPCCRSCLWVFFLTSCSWGLSRYRQGNDEHHRTLREYTRG